MFYALESGGVRTYLNAKSDWFATHTRIHHTVVAPASCKDLHRSAFAGIPSVAIPHVAGYRIPLLNSMAARTLRALRPDLIEAGDPYQLAWVAARVGKELDVPLVAFYHSDLPEVMHQRFGNMAQAAAIRYTRYLYRKFDLVLAPSAVMVQRLHDMGITQVRHQPLGVDTRLFSPARRDAGLRRSLNLPDNTRLLVYAGRFMREKKLPLLIDAVHRLGAPYHLLMIGNGQLPRASPYITHLPFQRVAGELARLLASCDVLVHPGDQETFGLVVLEAMACGIPVLGVRAGGVGELVARDTGVLVAPNCVAALCDGIRQIFALGPVFLGRHARDLMLRKYDWNLIMPQLIGHYGSLLATHQRAELEASVSYVID